MRVRLVFSILRNNGLLPFHQQGILHTFFQQHLDRFPREVLYEPIQISFSGVKGHSIVHRDGLEYDSPKITVVVSSPYKFLIEELIEEIFSWPSFELDCLVVKPSQALVELPPDFFPEENYVCLSPLAVRYVPGNQLENKKHLEPEDPFFNRLLWESTFSRMKSSGFFAESEWQALTPFQFNPDLDYIQKSVEMNRKISRMYALPSTEAGTEIRAYTFPFQLSADPEIHKFLFYCGFGAFTQRGFGMLDLANKTQRVVIKEYPTRRR
jgi:CRISPR-associated endoribonuclease Cas6